MSDEIPQQSATNSSDTHEQRVDDNNDGNAIVEDSPIRSLSKEELRKQKETLKLESLSALSQIRREKTMASEAKKRENPFRAVLIDVTSNYHGTRVPFNNSTPYYDGFSPLKSTTVNLLSFKQQNITL